MYSMYDATNDVDATIASTHSYHDGFSDDDDDGVDVDADLLMTMMMIMMLYIII